MNICNVCHKTVKPGLSIEHSVCGHMTHGHCMNQNSPDFERCIKCVSTTATAVLKQQPRSYKGRDYVSNPLPDNTFSRIAGKLTRSKLPFLDKGLPLEHLIAQHGAHLQFLLANRVTWQDLLNNGYTWEDAQVFSDLASRDDRTRQALVALRVNATHFNTSIPIEDISGCVTPRAIVEQFGLYFSETGAPLTAFNRDWTLKDLADLNFTVDDLFGAGLHNLEQYEYLAPTPELEEKMGITAADIDELPSIGAPLQYTCDYGPEDRGEQGKSLYEYSGEGMALQPQQPQIIVVEKPVYIGTPVASASASAPPLRYRQPKRFHGLKE